MGQARSPSERWSGLVAVLVFVALLGVLLRPPLRDFATKTFCAADITQEYMLTSLFERRRPGNPILSDTGVQMQPWFAFDRDVLRSGEVPLWNPYNAAGMPQLANYQSAVFSPFSLPYYLLGAKAAPIVAAFLKLACAAAGMAWFLRKLGLGVLAALCGATTFAFAGQFVLLLGYPHTGVNATLGFALTAAECALQAFERRSGRRAIALPLAGLALALAAGLLAGHPEAFAFVLALVAAWTVTRWIGLARRRAEHPGVLRLGAGLVVAGLIGAALAAPQVLPFLEYVAQTAVFGARRAVTAPSMVSNWPLAFFPNAVGSPLPEAVVSLRLPVPNYPQVNSHYVGASALCAAFVGLCFAFRERRMRFFAYAALAWLVLTCDLFGLGAVYSERTPLGRFAPLPRAQIVWILGVSGLVALAVERVLAGERKRPFAALGLVALGLASWWPTRAAARALFEAHAAEIDANQLESIRAAIEHSTTTLSLAFGLGVAALAAALVVPWRLARGALLVVLLGAIFTATGWTLRDYNPTIPDRFVYPRTEAMDLVCGTVGDGRLVILGENGLPPNTNLMYRLGMLQGYDALGVRRFDEFARLTLSMRGNWRDIGALQRNSLHMFGVDYVLTGGEWLPINTALGTKHLQQNGAYRPLALEPECALEQTFVCDRAQLASVAALVSVVAGTEPRESGLRMRLVDDSSGELVAERLFDAAEIRRDPFVMTDIALTWRPFPIMPGHAFRWATLDFAPRAEARGRRFRLTLEATAPANLDAVTAWVTDGYVVPDTTVTYAGEALPAVSIFDYAAPRAFESLGRVARFTLWRATDSLGEFFTVARAFESTNRRQTLLTLSGGNFDPYRAVVIERHPDAPEDAAATRLEFPAALASLPWAEPVEVLARGPNRVRLRAARSEPGWLVACRSFYPGWRAYVDGVERPIACANFAFQAVELPAGEHEVELVFDPASFRWGVRIALVGLIGLVCLAGFSWGRRRARVVAQ